MKKNSQLQGLMSASDVVLSYLKSFSTGDPALVASHVTEDFENNQMGVLGQCFVGQNIYLERLAVFLGTFTDLKYTSEEIICDGDKVAISYLMTANVDGCDINIPGVMTIMLREGIICKRNDYWDGLTYHKQIADSKDE
ncbi:MAG: ketosteroid isomerase-like protein [Gammaproteobacteria bacterium]|jgi:ketosteroid isomerase-like protein